MTISATAKSQVFKQEGGGFLTYLNLTHTEPSFTSPIRLVNNTVDVTSGGNLYTAYPFNVRFPDDSDQSLPRAQLVLDNVTRELTQIVRNMTTPILVDMFVTRIDAPNTVEVLFPQFTLRNVHWDILTITGDLTLDDAQNESFPQRYQTPAEYPGLF